MATVRQKVDLFLHNGKLRASQLAMTHAASTLRRRTAFMGSAWGGWAIVPEVLGPESIIYSGGIGEDSSFDIAVIRRFGCQVHGFDPTPRGRAHAEGLAREEHRFIFHPVGVWHEDTTLRFYAPQDPSHDSWSALNLQQTTDYVECAVRSLPSLMNELGHRRIDLLKIDIEGAEYHVLDQILTEGLPIGQICVEFDQPAPSFGAPAEMARRLGEAGFSLVARRGWDETFLALH